MVDRAIVDGSESAMGDYDATRSRGGGRQKKKGRSNFSQICTGQRNAGQIFPEVRYLEKRADAEQADFRASIRRRQPSDLVYTGGDGPDADRATDL
jgi:hypothetical protein